MSDKPLDNLAGDYDRNTQAAAEQILRGRHRGGLWSRLAPFLGPAFIASVAYMDPGNFATNIEGGSKFGYMLLWVVVTANLMAMLIQLLSAKLGVATGRNLAELCRDRLPPSMVWTLWVVMEIVAMATDLAEFVGAALGFQLLFGIPLWAGGILTVIATFALLIVQSRGFRLLEGAITVLVAVVAGCYLIETFLDKPDWVQLAKCAVTPRFKGVESVILAAGILGATVMPHAIFLHSSLTQGRVRVTEPAMRQRLYRYQIVDVLLAMTIAGMVNAAMLVMAAATFNHAGLVSLATIEEAHRTLEPLLGRAAKWVFAISLVASGLSSSVVGTMSGQVIMQGFVHFSIPMWIRRAVTILPSMVVILAGFDPTRTLVWSQVVLSFALPGAIVPLVMFTSNRKLMGDLVNRPAMTVAAWLIGSAIIVLNLFLLWRIFTGSA
ncbi:MAG: Nramp family divalent metal transporter [Tepidisphaeraceae bacterium]